MRSLFIIVIVGLLSCTNSADKNNRLTASDSVVINFNTPQSNTIEKTVTTTEKNAIKKMARFIDSKASPAYKCGYDGNIIFYKKGNLEADVAFNYSGAGCQHFVEIIADQVSSTSMSNEAIDFLKSLHEGKNWY